MGGLVNSLVSFFLPPLQKQWVASLVFAACFFGNGRTECKSQESTCDYLSPRFLKLTGPLSVLLIGCLADVAAPHAGGPVMVKPPSPGGGWGAREDFGVITQMFPGVAWSVQVFTVSDASCACV